MANIMQQVKLRNHTSRDGFDLSRRNAFTAKIGELLPVVCIECIPGDKFDLKVQHFTRTMPVNTAAYTRMREYYDWFFVPTELLWNKFNSFVTQMTENNQHAVGINASSVLTDTHPYFTTNQIHTYIRDMTPPTSGGLEPNNILGFQRRTLTVKLLDYLGYGDFTPSLTGNTFSTLYKNNANLNPFPLLAYQKIYSDYYRNSQWEKAFAPAFNIDYISGTAESLNLPISGVANSTMTENMFDLRYCNWNKDLFMGLLPNSQYGSAASVLGNGTFSGSVSSANVEGITPMTLMQGGSLGSNIIQPAYGYLLQTSDGTPVNGLNLTEAGAYRLREALGINTANNINTTFAILTLRQAEALQKWKEITQSQQQDYKSQIEAHFGVSPDNGYSDRCRWIDGHVSNLDISEVTNNNITDDNPADIAGKGVGVGEGKTKFKTEVHGYLMCIYHCTPLLDYSISGIQRRNLKTKVTDYAIPEFDRTGMVSVPAVEFTNNIGSGSVPPTLLGYAPRYYDYKQAIDEVHGEFKKTLSHWVAPFTDSYFRSIAGPSGLTYPVFKVNPSTMNPIFTFDADSTTATDQLLVNASFNIGAVRNLDRNGLPY